MNKKYFTLIQNAVQSNLERQVSLDTICYKIHLNLQLADAYRMKVGNNWTSAQGKALTYFFSSTHSLTLFTVLGKGESLILCFPLPSFLKFVGRIEPPLI